MNLTRGKKTKITEPSAFDADSPFLTKRTTVDRNYVFDESVCGVLMPFPRSSNKILLVIAVLALVPFAGVVARAAGEWRLAGATPNGDEVLVSSISSQKGGARTAWVRIEYKEPMKLPQGGPFVEVRARVRFNCSNGGEAPNSMWFYSRSRSGKLVVSKKARHDDQFGSAAEGGFAGIAHNFVCEQK